MCRLPFPTSHAYVLIQAEYCRKHGLIIVADRPLETVDENGEPVRLWTYEEQTGVEMEHGRGRGTGARIHSCCWYDGGGRASCTCDMSMLRVCVMS